MILDNLEQFESRVRALPSLAKNSIRLHALDGSVKVVIFGEQPGTSPEYAWLRRKRWMADIRRVARQLGVDVVFDFSELNDRLGELERAVYDDINAQGLGHPFSLAIEFNKTRHARATIDLGDRRASVSERKALADLVRTMLRAHGTKRIEKIVLLDAGAEEATDPQVLRILRTIGPCSKEALRDTLEGHECRVPSIQWLNRTLDRLRQKGFVRYVGDGLFSLSPRALFDAPARAGRTSADVQRALALARRKTW